MSDSISINIDGGTTEERGYVSAVIEKSLTDNGFTSVQNTVVPGESTDETFTTLLDYATKANPELFNQSISINEFEPEEVVQEPDSPVTEETGEAELEVEEIPAEDD